MDFSCNENEKFLIKLVAHSNMHPIAQYEIIWENYPFKLALTSTICLERHKLSYSIAHFEKSFFTIFALFQVCWFVLLLRHKLGCNTNVLHIYDFFELFNPVSKCGQNREGGHDW